MGRSKVGAPVGNANAKKYNEPLAQVSFRVPASFKKTWQANAKNSEHENLTPWAISRLNGIKMHRHDETPDRHTGVLIIDDDNGDLTIMGINEYSTLHGWGDPVKPGQYWVYESDIYNLLTKL